MKRRSIFFLLFAAFFTVKAQERLGIANSNYFSTSSIQLNPSSSVDSRVYMQLNLVGANVYFKTNMGYLPHFGIKDIVNIPSPVRSTVERKQFLHAGGIIDGPSFVISKRQYGAGFFVRGRAVVDMRRVPYDLASMLLRGSFFNSADDVDLVGQNFRNAKFSTMTWVEYGVNFGRMIKKDRNTLFTLGGNLKYLTGIGISYTDFIRFKSHRNSNSIGVDELRAITKQNEAKWNSGKGFGLDIGVTYKKMLGYVDAYYANSTRSNCEYVDYKYKLGLALRDAGFIRYTGNTTETRVDGSGHLNPNRSDTSFSNALQYNFNSTTTTGKPIWACLPTALTGQFDWNVDNYLYLNVTAIKIWYLIE